MNDHINTILNLKENLAQRKLELFNEYQCPILSIQVNIPGVDKLNGWSAYVVQTFENEVESKYSPIKKIQIFNHLGVITLMIINTDAKSLKEWCIHLESMHLCGRCVDLDVFDHDRPLSRIDLGHQERPCLVCDDMARVCIINQKHSTSEALKAFQSIITNSIRHQKEEQVRFALLCECMLTPKFGLVTPLTQGIHTDMNIQTFLTSINAIIPYFKDVQDILLNQPLEDIFKELRLLGQRMEKVMFEATQGVNTHKGAIFLFLMVLMAQRLPFPSLSLALKQLSLPILKDFESINPNKACSEGEKQFLKYHTLGVRGFICSAGEPLLSHALAYYNSKDVSNHHQVNTLLLIMSQCEDSTIIKKVGLQGLRAFQAYALKTFENPHLWEEFEAYNLLHHTSAGGAADIFALVVYLSLTQERSMI